MTPGIVTVFGGTGFLGKRVVRHLLAHGVSVRVASRHPRDAAPGQPEEGASAEPIAADINDDRSVASAVAGVGGVVNAVSLYVESGGQTFRSVHVEAAARVARLAREAGVERLAHVSGIGSDARSRSSYIRSRGEGEEAVRAEFPGAIIIRPAVMFGADDAFLVPLTGMLRRFPVFPLFGRGATRVQPAYVEDVAEAIARSLQRLDPERCYELGGPRVYTYRSLLETISRRIGTSPLLIPAPFGIWEPLAYAAEMLPEPPITRNQVELMEIDNVAAADLPGMAALEIVPTPIEAVLGEILGER